MKAFLLASGLIAAVAVAASFVLDGEVQITAADQYTTSGARVGDPGQNLIDWQ